MSEGNETREAETGGAAEPPLAVPDAVHQRIRASQLVRVAIGHRSVSISTLTLGVIIAAALHSPYPPFVPALWLGGVVIYTLVSIYMLQQALSNKEDIAANPARWVNRYALLYFSGCVCWAAMLPVFWSAEAPEQSLYVALIIVATSFFTVNTLAPIPRIFLAANIPFIVVMSGGALFLEDVVSPAIFVLNIGALAVNFLIARRIAKRDFDAQLLTIRHEELIRDMGNARDIAESALTSAKQANAELSSQEELFRALVENAKDGIILTDTAGNIRYMSPSVRNLGYDPSVYLGVHVSDMLTPDTRRLVMNHFQAPSRAAFPPLSITDQILTPTGRRIWVEARIKDMRRDPNVGGFVVNIRDITERKRIDEELAEHLEVLNALAHNASLDTILLRLMCNIEKTNPAIRAVLVTVENGRPQSVIAPSLPRAFKEGILSGTVPYQGLIAGTYASGAAHQAKNVIVPNADMEGLDPALGEMMQQMGLRAFWSQPLHARKGRLLGALAIFHIQPHTPSARELSQTDGAAHLAGLAIERRQHEDELREAMERADLANRAKSRFLATMSHELRTPLNAIIGFSEIMHTELFGALGDDHYSDYAKDILMSGRHLLSVIDDILDISKIEAGRYELEDRDVTIEDVIEWSVLLTQPKANEKHITIASTLAPELPRLIADLRAMRQILLNLLANAVKFTPNYGRISINVEIAANGGLEITVSDTGIGIPADKIEYVMQPFGQATNHLTEHQSGTGLGLPICKSLIEMHEGTLQLESRENEGTTVHLWLPPARLRTADAVLAAR
ncbi:ATP-binding protein [Tepidicaulis sp. LMO-SS28]|uniref:sensor histidine kinase n=1 Tax=Tepidicaulis sp. LMO-SS28 TaxID=3447455 RepID=UPI003EE112F7